MKKTNKHSSQIKENSLEAANALVEFVEGDSTGVCLAMAVTVPICLDFSFPCAVMGA